MPRSLFHFIAFRFIYKYFKILKVCNVFPVLVDNFVVRNGEIRRLYCGGNRCARQLQSSQNRQVTSTYD